MADPHVPRARVEGEQRRSVRSGETGGMGVGVKLRNKRTCGGKVGGRYETEGCAADGKSREIRIERRLKA